MSQIPYEPNLYSAPKSPLMTPKSPSFRPAPESPPHPPGISSNHNKPRVNPIIDLLETEEEYVNDLKTLIQKTTTSWTHDNPPPPELDRMFCLVNDVFKENEDFYSSLSKIDVNPRNPRSAQEIADILMVWVDQMERPYTKYYQEYRKGFDSWPEIEGNASLQQILNTITAEKNRPMTLDYFFELPLKRIYYYKKLYARIHKSSEPGKPDYEILTNANQRIDNLLELEELAKKNAIRPRDEIQSSEAQNENDDDHQRNNVNKETRKLTLQDLEVTLDTSRVVDLFTKRPKVRQLLIYFRFALKFQDSQLLITHVKAHLFLLSDLLLICQRLSPEEKKQNPTKEFWLLYPPMSGRHLSVLDMHDDKEENKGLKKVWLSGLVEMIEFTSNISALVRSPTKPKEDLVNQGDNHHEVNQALSDVEKKSPTSGNFSNDQHQWSQPKTPISPDYPQFLPESSISREPEPSIEPFAETLFQTSLCNVSTWADEWRPLNAQDNCYIEIRLTMDKRYYMVVVLENYQMIVLQLLIDQSVHVHRDSPCAITITCEMGQRRDYYYINLSTSFEADKLFTYLTRPENNVTELNAPSSLSPKVETEFAPRTSSLQTRDNGLPREIESDPIRLIESRCRVFLKNDHAMWTNFGWGTVKVLLEVPSNQKRIMIMTDKQKSKMVDAIICEAGVEKVGKTGIAITINNIPASYGGTTIIYMIQMKDEIAATKAFK
ncbi:4787_t:CDS:2, partial [Acaulospora colombiana]